MAQDHDNLVKAEFGEEPVEDRPLSRRKKRELYPVRAFGLQPGRHVLLTHNGDFRIYPADQWPEGKTPPGRFEMAAEDFERLLKPVDFEGLLAGAYGEKVARAVCVALWTGGVVAPGDVITRTAETRVVNAMRDLARQALATLERRDNDASLHA